MSDAKYNLKNPGVKRIMQEAKELANDSNYEYSASPLEENIFEWHFTVRGPKDTDFEEGRYHGRILLPTEYPFKPPEIIFLTANGRFQLHTKICLSITGFHPEFWQPAWGIRTVLLAIIGFFPTESRGAIGGLDYPKEERQRLAKKSIGWVCSVCGVNTKDALSDTPPQVETHQKEELPEFVITCKESKEKSSSSSENTTQSEEIEKPKAVESSNIHNNDMIIDNNRSQVVEQDAFSIQQQPTGPEIRSASVIAAPRTVIAEQSRQVATAAAPVWLDALIAGLVSFIVVLVCRRYVF